MEPRSLWDVIIHKETVAGQTLLLWMKTSTASRRQVVTNE